MNKDVTKHALSNTEWKVLQDFELILSVCDMILSPILLVQNLMCVMNMAQKRFYLIVCNDVKLRTGGRAA
jgi:hypothetical protein